MKKIIQFYIVLVGCFSVNAQSYDLSFHFTGAVFPPHDAEVASNIWDTSSAKQIVLQPDGKIILNVLDNGIQSLLWRYNPDGSVDSTFGTNGKVTFGYTINTPASGWSAFNFIELQPDGKLLLVGYSHGYNSGAGHISVVRLNTDGSFDNTFGVNGKIVITNPSDPAGTNSAFRSLNNGIRLANGKIVLMIMKVFAGNGIYPASLVQLNADYTLDTAFGTGGYFEPAFGFPTDRTDLIASENNGFLIPVDNGVIKVKSDGTLDTAFGVGGLKTLPRFARLTQLADGKFLTSRMTKYNADFTLDTSFNNGVVNDNLAAVVVQSDNKIITIKNIASSGFVTSYTAMIRRYTQNGTLELERQLVFPGEYSDLSEDAFDLKIDSNGNILVCGDYTYNAYQVPHYAPFLARILPAFDPALSAQQVTGNPFGIKIYPNPFTDRLTLAHTTDHNEIVDIDLYDLQGRIVQSLAKHEAMAAGKQQREFHLSGGLSAGQYLLKIGTDSGTTQVIKVVKQ